MSSVKDWEENRKKQFSVMEGPGGGTPQPATGSRAYLYQNVEGPGGGTQPALAQRYQDMEKAQAAPAQQPAQQAPAAPQATAQQPIQAMQGVTQSTQEKLKQAQGGYQPSDAAIQAQQALQALQSQKPQGYTDKYTPQLEGILQQIQSQKDFRYELNADPFFKSLADRKVQDAKQASMNAMGQGAALTGGYGNSAAQAVAQQAYQEQMRGLYDEGLQLMQMAYDRDRDQRADLYNQAGLIQNLQQQGYNQYRDTVGDWEREREYQTGRYDTETDRAISQQNAMLDYYTRLAEIENADYRSEQERQEAIRQFNLQYQADMERFGWQKDVDQRDYNRGVLESDRNYDFNQQQFNWQQDVDRRNYDRDVLESDRAYDMNQRQFDWQQEVDQRNFDRDVLESDRAYDLNRQQFGWQQEVDQRDFNEQRRRADQDEAFRQRQLAEQIRQFQESLDWDKLSMQQKYNYEVAMNILANGQMPSEELLASIGLSNADVQKLMAQATSGSGGSGKNTYYLDAKGNPYKQNKDGSLTPVDPSEPKRGDEFIENADQAIGISGLVTGVKNMVGKNQDLIKKLLGKGN